MGLTCRSKYRALYLSKYIIKQDELEIPLSFYRLYFKHQLPEIEEIKAKVDSNESFFRIF